ncbi:MAG: PorV/PorQ family protein [Gemmatimonadetes bacterium]|nr:PorV/PorQ family protein [Gemmatimonadota bacterium]
MGLGGAVVASRADVEGVLWNPASAAGIERPTAYFHVANDFGTSSQVVGFLGRWQALRVGLAYYHFGMGSIEARDESNQDIGLIALDDDALILTGGYGLSSTFDLGVSYKLVRLSSACSGDCGSVDGRSIGHAFDLGVTADIGAARGLSVGAVLRNLGPGIRISGGSTTDPMPTRLRVGALLDVLHAFLPGEDTFGVVLQADVQQTVTEFDDLEGYLGSEASLRGILYLRAGYAWSTAGRSGAALGIGLRYDRLVVDLGRAFDDFSSFDSDSPFQLSLAFGF